MRSLRGRGDDSGVSRHELANRERGSRARNHLAQARNRQRRRLKRRERDRERARVLGGSIDLRQRLRRPALFALSLSIGLGLAALLGEPMLSWLGPDYGAVDTIAIQGNTRLSFNEVAAATGVARGSALATIDSSEVEERLLGVPWIEDAHVLRLPPATLLVRIREREPHAILVAANGERPDRLVDARGTPFAGEPLATDLPRIVGGGDLDSGRTHEVLRAALDLLESLRAISPDGLIDDDGRLALYLPEEEGAEGWVVRGAAEVVLGRERLDERFGRLAELLRSSALETAAREGLIRIDLRFADQAVLSRAKL